MRKLVKPIILSQWAILCTRLTHDRQYAIRTTATKKHQDEFILCSCENTKNTHLLEPIRSFLAAPKAHRINIGNLKMIKIVRSNFVEEEQKNTQKPRMCDETKRSKTVHEKRRRRMRRTNEKSRPKKRRKNWFLFFRC